MSNTENGDHSPPYQRIADELRERIVRGHIAVDEALPSYNKIARIHGVALSTAQKAVSVLRDEGLVMSVNGQATYVIANKPYPRDHTHVLRMFTAMQRRIDSLEATVRDIKKIMDRTPRPPRQAHPHHH